MSMKTRRLMATKTHTYGTRALKAGDEYDAPEMDAILMVLAKKARFAPRVRPSPSPPPAKATEPPPWVGSGRPGHPFVGEAAAEEAQEPEEKPEAKNIERLRAEAEALGIEVDGRWGALRLEHEIGAAKRR